MSSFIRETQQLCCCFAQKNTGVQNGEQDDQHKHLTLLVPRQKLQKQPSMSVTLRKLEETMDPMIAAQVWNNRYSLLARLPEELLLQIFGFLAEKKDIVSLCCLRRICGTFRRIIDGPPFWRVISPYFTEAYFHLYRENHAMLTRDQANELKQLLQRDGMCENCSLHCDGPVKGIARKIAHYWYSQADRERVFHLRCKFQHRGGMQGHCPSCDKYHDMVAFSDREATHTMTRKCLGWQGSVQLCEHVHISWSQIEAHLKKWRPTDDDNWQPCFDNFNIVCRHPSHDTRCSPKAPPTWPRATLKGAPYSPGRVILNLEWIPHSGLNCFNVKNNQVPAPELRELFKNYQQGAGRIFLPAYPSNPIPEMGCFDPRSCRCVHYETGQPDEISTTDSAGDVWNHPCNELHTVFRNHGSGYNGTRVHQTKHYPNPFSEAACLITRYERDITVYRESGGKGNIIAPTHEWFHAMDPDTYAHPRNPHALPLCKDKNCMNYYKRPQTYRCVGQYRPRRRPEAEDPESTSRFIKFLLCYVPPILAYYVLAYIFIKSWINYGDVLKREAAFLKREIWRLARMLLLG